MVSQPKISGGHCEVNFRTWFDRVVRVELKLHTRLAVSVARRLSPLEVQRLPGAEPPTPYD